MIPDSSESLCSVNITPFSGGILLFFELCPVTSARTSGRTSAVTAAHCNAERETPDEERLLMKSPRSHSSSLMCRKLAELMR